MLLPPGSGAQINTCLPTPLHSAIFPFVFCLKQLSPIPEAGTWCLQTMTVPNTGRASKTFCPSLSQGSLPALKCLRGVALAQLRSLLSICWHCPSKDSPCVWKLGLWSALHPLVACCARAGTQSPVDPAWGRGREPGACLPVMVRLRYSDAISTGKTMVPPPILNSKWNSKRPPSTKRTYLPAATNRFFVGFPMVNI